VSVGVMVLVIVLSVMGGFQREFHEKIRGTMADVIVSQENFEMENYEELIEKITAIPGVEAASPFIQNIMLIKGVRVDFGFIKGIDTLREPAVTKLKQYILRPEETETLFRYDMLKLDISDYEAMFELGERDAAESGTLEDLKKHPRYVLMKNQLESLRKEFSEIKGEYDKLADREPMTEEEIYYLFADKKTDLPALLVGYELFKHYQMHIGCEVTLLTASGINVEEPNQQRFEIVGSFRTGMFENDFRFAYATLYDAQQFIGMPDAASGISVKLTDFRDADRICRLISHIVNAGPATGIAVRTWQEQNRTLLQAVRMEKWLLGFIIFFIVIVAGFTIVSILAMMVIEKTKDLGIVKSLGGTTSGVMTIFLIAGSFIGLVGSAIGSFLGYMFVSNLNEVASLIEKITGYHPFPPNIYYLDKIPTQVDWVEIVSVVIPTVLVSFLFALYPAIKASRLNPVEALRYE
jgi:ABC-type lipoprotein release transport system permease subunit